MEDIHVKGRTSGGLQDLEGWHMSLMSPRNVKIFGAVAGILQDHYPVRAAIPPGLFLLKLLLA